MLFLFLEGTALIDRRNLRHLIPAGMAGLILAGAHIGLPERFTVATLSDTGPISHNVPLILLMQAMGSPVAAMWFVRDIGTTGLAVARRIVQFSLISQAFFWMAVEAGRAVWRGPGWQFVYNVGWYTLIWAVHVYCQGWFRRHSAGSHKA